MEPESREEWERRFHENQKISGYGMATTMHMPCPFCAAPGFLVYRIIDSEDAMVDGAVCKECGRGAAVEFSVNTPSNKQFEMVQTAGPDQPTWLDPPMRKDSGGRTQNLSESRASLTCSAKSPPP